jgi:hypothetical protein
MNLRFPFRSCGLLSHSASPSAATSARSLPTPSAPRGPTLFAFDNGVGRGSQWTPEKQAAVLATLGYDGIGYTGVTDLAERQRAFQGPRTPHLQPLRCVLR